MDVSVGQVAFLLVRTIFCGLLAVRELQGQTEGDTGYDYSESEYADVYDEEALSNGPTFDVRMANVTVVDGQTAVLPCSIEFLAKHRVAWLDFNSFPLTFEDRRVIDDTRFGIVRPSNKEWNLQIRDVKTNDSGQYRCTINTQPVTYKTIMLYVMVPPEIIGDSPTRDITVREGDSVFLNCKAKGIPTPEVTWYRIHGGTDKRLCNLPDMKHVKGSSDSRTASGKGETLLITNISRHCDATYECVANNGVPISDKRQLRVEVEFPPHITMPNSRIGQIRGRRETILNCLITANPQVSNVWQKEGKHIPTSAKHSIETYDEGDHTITLSLRIHDLTVSDYGAYTCVASNAHGRAEGVVYLFESDSSPLQHPHVNVRATAKVNRASGLTAHRSIFTGWTTATPFAREQVFHPVGEIDGFSYHNTLPYQQNDDFASIRIEPSGSSVASLSGHPSEHFILSILICYWFFVFSSSVHSMNFGSSQFEHQISNLSPKYLHDVS